MSHYSILVNNRWQTTGDSMPVFEPYRREKIAEVCRAGSAEADAAVAAALTAFGHMRAMPAYARAQLLSRTADGIADRADAFAETIAREAGKPITAARGEVARAITTFSLAAQEATRLQGEVLPLDIAPSAGNRLGITRRFPMGVVLAITPFNFPLNLVAHKLAPALAAGNTVVLKPASATPLTALLLGEVLLEAGLPEGAVNIIPCRADVAEQLVRDPRPAMLSFTGSAEVGWRLKGVCGRKKIALELGGNAAAVIEPDADLEHALERCLAGGYSCAGQVCISLQRVYVHERVYDAFARRFVDLVAGLPAGDPMDERTVVGPLIEPGEIKRLQEWVAEAVQLGGRVLTGGTGEATLFAPTVLEAVPPAARCMRGEVFGPVTVLCRYSDFDEALAAVNDSSYGLQAGIFSRDMQKVFRAFHHLEVGGVIVDDVPTFRVDNFPYGGVKESGLGREGVRYAMEEMTEVRVLVAPAWS